MLTNIVPLALLATLGTAGAALSNTSAGTIADISAITGDVTLENGMEFRFDDEDTGKLDNFKPGDRVSVGYITVGDDIRGLSISPLK